MNVGFTHVIECLRVQSGMLTTCFCLGVVAGLCAGRLGAFKTGTLREYLRDVSQDWMFVVVLSILSQGCYQTSSLACWLVWLTQVFEALSIGVNLVGLGIHTIYAVLRAAGATVMQQPPPPQ